MPVSVSFVEVTSVTDDHQGAGLKGTIETIDNRTDFRNYMQNYAFARGGNNVRVLRREGPRDEGFVRST